MWMKLWTSQRSCIAGTSNCTTVAANKGTSSNDANIAIHWCTKPASSNKPVWVCPVLCLWRRQSCIGGSVRSVPINLLSWHHWPLATSSWSLWCISLLMVWNKSFHLLIIQQHLTQHLIIVRLLQQRTHQLLLATILHEVRDGSSGRLFDDLLRLRCCTLIHGCN